VIIPLVTSSYLSIAKNSSLAVAIGYPHLVNIANTAANQRVRAWRRRGALDLRRSGFTKRADPIEVLAALRSIV